MSNKQQLDDKIKGIMKQDDNTDRRPRKSISFKEMPSVMVYDESGRYQKIEI